MKNRFKGCKKITEEIFPFPQTFQKSIPINRIAQNGIFELEKKKGNHLFDKTYLFTDINFTTADEDGKEEIAENIGRLLNSLNVPFKEIVINKKKNITKLKEGLLLEKKGKPFDPFIEEYNRMVMEKMSSGRQGIEQLKLFILTCSKSDFEKAKNYFTMVEANIIPQFRKLKSSLLPLNGIERLKILHSYYRQDKSEDDFKVEWEDLLNIKRDWRNEICGKYLKEHKDYLELDEGWVCTSLFVRKYPKTIADTFYTELINVPFQSTITKDIVPVPTPLAIKNLDSIYMGIESSIQKQQQTHNKNNNFSSEVSYKRRREKDEIEEYMDRVHENDEKLYMLGLYITIWAPDKEELKKRMETIKMIGNTYSVEFEVYTGCQLKTWKTTLPVGARFVDAMRSLFTESMEIFVPFNVQELQHSRGLFYGINQVSKNVLKGDRRKLKNGNGFVFGSSGTGKSFFTKQEIGQVLLAYSNSDVIIVDPQNEYFSVAELFGGQIINLSTDTENYVNPLRIPDEKKMKNTASFIADKAEFMKGICAQAFYPEIMNAKHGAIIDRCVRKMYTDIFDGKNRALKSPTMVDFRDTVKEQEGEDAKQVYAVLESFVEGSLNIFARESNVDEENRCIVYGMQDLGQSLWAMGMLIMIENIRARISYNQRKGRTTWVFIDEAHVLMHDEYSRLALEKLWKEVRKQGGFCTGITQNIIDCLNDKTTKTMIANSEFTVLLGQAAVERDALLEVMDISDAELDFVSNADSGTGIQRWGEKIIPFDIRVDKKDPYYKWFNTNFHELHAEKEFARQPTI